MSDYSEFSQGFRKGMTMLKSLMLTLLLFAVSALLGCGQQESDHFKLEEVKQQR